MYTPTETVAAEIRDTLVRKFAADNDINPDHLLEHPDRLTAAELLRAHRALGAAVLS